MKRILPMLLVTAVLTSHCINSSDEGDEEQEKNHFGKGKTEEPPGAKEIEDQVKGMRIEDEERAASQGDKSEPEKETDREEPQRAPEPQHPKMGADPQHPKMGADPQQPKVEGAEGPPVKQEGVPLYERVRWRFKRRGAIRGPSDSPRGAEGYSPPTPSGPQLPPGPPPFDDPSATPTDISLETTDLQNAPNTLFESIRPGEKLKCCHYVAQTGFLYSKVLYKENVIWLSMSSARCYKVTMCKVRRKERTFIMLMTDGSQLIMTKKGKEWTGTKSEKRRTDE